MHFSAGAFFLFMGAALGHSAHEAPHNIRRDTLNFRRDFESRCGAAVSARRLAKRAFIAKRDDSTCTVTPEVTQGPYHILREVVRQNITEGQAGVPLQLEIDYIDISTCSPIKVWTDMWHANSTGYYSGYTEETGSALSGSGSGGSAGAGQSGSPMSGANPQFSGSAMMSGGPAPSGQAAQSGGEMGGSGPNASASGSGADSSAAGGGLDQSTTDSLTFLRGVWQSDDDGHLTAYSIIPGWYSGRAQHFHIKAYTDGYIAANGSFVPSGDAHHTGQLFFPQDFLDKVAATEPYSSNYISWSDAVLNTDDQWYPYQSEDGYDADVTITYIDENDITKGVIGSITVAINTTYDSAELSDQYASFDVSSLIAAGLDPSASGASGYGAVTVAPQTVSGASAVASGVRSSVQGSPSVVASNTSGAYAFAQISAACTTLAILVGLLNGNVRGALFDRYRTA